MSTKPDFSKINAKRELAALEQHVRSRWEVGSDFNEMLQIMYETVQTYGRHWYDWNRISDWIMELSDKREETLSQKWGEQHINGLKYIDLPLIYTEVLLSQTRNLERELDRNNVEAYHHKFLSEDKYKNLKAQFPWLENSKPVGIDIPGMGYNKRIKDVALDEEEFQGHSISYATRPGFVQAIDVGYIKEYTPDTAHEELCTAIMIHLESIHRHNQAIDLINEIDRMGINNNSVYPVFEDTLKTEHLFANVLKKIVQSKQYFRLNNLENPNIKTIIAHFLDDPQNSKSVFEELLPYIEIRKAETFDMSQLIQLLEDPNVVEESYGRIKYE